MGIKFSCRQSPSGYKHGMCYRDEIFDVIKRCGGPLKIKDESAGTIESDRTPYKWPRVGIPERHWSLITRLSGVEAPELHELNERARQESCSA